MQRRIYFLLQNLNFHLLSLSLPRLGPAQSVSHRALQLLGPALIVITYFFVLQFSGGDDIWTGWKVRKIWHLIYYTSNWHNYGQC